MTDTRRRFRILHAARTHKLVALVWLALIVLMVLGAFLGRWQVSFVAAATLCVTMTPLIFESWSGVQVPSSFLWAMILFTLATLLMGELGNFYERIWWWDLMLHLSSATGFGIVGFLIVLTMVRGDRLSAAPSLIALLAFCFALAMGTLWEVFEFLMDLGFGLNMQKSGLIDTMSDLGVSCIGALLGALSGYAYLKGARGQLSAIIRDFIDQNKSTFRRK